MENYGEKDSLKRWFVTINRVHRRWGAFHWALSYNAPSSSFNTLFLAEFQTWLPLCHAFISIVSLVKLQIMLMFWNTSSSVITRTLVSNVAEVTGRLQRSEWLFNWISVAWIEKTSRKEGWWKIKCPHYKSKRGARLLQWRPQGWAINDKSCD